MLQSHVSVAFHVTADLETDERVRRPAIAALAYRVETTQPAAFAELYKSYSMKGLDVQDDGAVHWFGGLTAFDPNIDFKGLTWGHTSIGASYFSGTSPAAVDVVFQDIMAFLVKQAFARELPQGFLDLMAADLDGQLAADYRGYIRHEIKPVLDRLKDIMQAHVAAIEAPPLSWLIDTFPNHGNIDNPNNIPHATIAYARAWDRVLAEWDAGRLDVLYPPSNMMPFSAMHKFNLWSKERGEAKQQELIGMSSGKKDASTKVLDALGGRAEE